MVKTCEFTFARPLYTACWLISVQTFIHELLSAFLHSKENAADGVNATVMANNTNSFDMSFLAGSLSSGPYVQEVPEPVTISTPVRVFGALIIAGTKT